MALADPTDTAGMKKDLLLPEVDCSTTAGANDGELLLGIGGDWTGAGHG
jgi:hypothetical protein